MAKRRRKTRPFQRKKKGPTKNLAPGTVLYTGKKENVVTTLEIIDYSKEHYEKVDTERIEDAFQFKGTDHVTWININGLSNTHNIETLGEHYQLHPLIQEDIVTTNQRPKMDEFDDYLYY